MNPELLYKYNQYRCQDRIEEARRARLVRIATRFAIPHPALYNLANGLISTGNRLRAFALGRPTFRSQNPSPFSGD